MTGEHSILTRLSEILDVEVPHLQVLCNLSFNEPKAGQWQHIRRAVVAFTEAYLALDVSQRQAVRVLAQELRSFLVGYWSDLDDKQRDPEGELLRELVVWDLGGPEIDDRDAICDLEALTEEYQRLGIRPAVVFDRAAEFVTPERAALLRLDRWEPPNL